MAGAAAKNSGGVRWPRCRTASAGWRWICRGRAQRRSRPACGRCRDLARWVAETCARLGLPRVTLVGHSFGGNLAAQVALDFPDLVRRLVLVDAALDPACLPIRARWPLDPRLGLPALRLMRLASLPLAALGRNILPDQSAGFWQAYARRTHWYAQANRDDRALQSQLQALADNPLIPARLTALRLPILILHGARDAVVPVAEAYALAQAVPQRKACCLPSSPALPDGH